SLREGISTSPPFRKSSAFGLSARHWCRAFIRSARPVLEKLGALQNAIAQRLGFVEMRLAHAGLLFDHNSRKSNMENIIILTFLIAIAGLLIWSGVRAYWIQNRFLKWGGMGFAAVLAVVVSSVNALTIAGMVKQRSRSAPIPDLKVEATPEQIARGKALADGFCSGCHSKTGTLTGGADIGQDIPIPVGSFVSSNLTPAGGLQTWLDGEIFRAIRNGIDADGRWLAMMSYTNAGRLSDEDIKALIAY